MKNKFKIFSILLCLATTTFFSSCDILDIGNPVITGASYDSSNSFTLFVTGNKDDVDIMRDVEVEHVDGTRYSISSCSSLIFSGDYKCRISGTFKSGRIRIRSRFGKLSGSAEFTVP